MVPASPPSQQPPGEDFFSILGVPFRFKQDLKELETHFYRLSREFHPDRFTMATPAEKQASLQRMSLINEAYRTLKDPAELRGYVLSRAGLGTSGGPGAQPKRGQIPAALAEEWFEIQDKVMESPAGALSLIERFEGHLAELTEKSNRAMAGIEEKIDGKIGGKIDSQGLESARAELEELSREVLSLNYLDSMKRDVERIKSRL